ncbi:MAG: GDSL-type esterase/lipase family protein [Bacillota bacterium]|nr:GDSL-type esterase/lipase family protein [Bacillota bacterium]
MSFTYVALGDSLSVGVGSSFFSTGFVQRYRRMAELELEDQMMVHVFARPGLLTKDILDEMNEEFVKEAIAEANIITITAGENDLIQAVRKIESAENEEIFIQDLKNSLENFNRIMLKINKIKSKNLNPYIIRIINLYNPYPNNSLAEKWIQKYNKALNIFSKIPQIAIVDINKVFRGYEEEYLSIGRLYPNDIGYERIAENLHRLGYGDIDFDLEKE